MKSEHYEPYLKDAEGTEWPLALKRDTALKAYEDAKTLMEKSYIGGIPEGQTIVVYRYLKEPVDLNGVESGG